MNLHPVELAGYWDLEMPAPRVVGDRARDPIGVHVGGSYVARLDMDPLTGAARETTDALIRRAARLHGTAELFTLAYP